MEKLIKLHDAVTLITLRGVDFQKAISVRDYIPIEEKLEFIDRYYSYLLKEDLIEDEFSMYYYFTMMAVELYTNLEFEYTYKNYDDLIKYGLIDRIFEQTKEDYCDLLKIKNMKHKTCLHRGG